MGSKKEPENLDMDVVAEQELSRLHRLYRIMEGDRFAYSGEASGKLQRQRKSIKILKKEQNNVLADLNVATSTQKVKGDAEINKDLETLLQDYDCVGQQVKKEKDSLTELNYQIKKMEKEVALIKTKAITDLQCQERVVAGERSVANLENRLDVFIKRFNTTTAVNSNLRSEIDHLLIERAHFNLLWERLISSLNQGKKFMLDLIEQATLAYDQREEWCNKLQALKARGNQDLIFHTKEMRFLQRKLDRDAKLQEFLGIKGQKRILADLEDREAKKRQQAKENMERQLAQYRETLEQIQDFCGESDVERLAAKFVKQEEENFALFNYVNELNHESESLSTTIEDLQKHIDAQRELNDKREKQQKYNIENLDAKLTEEKAKFKLAQNKLNKFDSDLSKVFNGIESIFKLLQCDNAPILELLGDNSKINPYNVRMYLGLIEKRTSELMRTVYFKERNQAVRVKRGKLPPELIKPDSKLRYKQQPLEDLVPTQPCPLCVEQEQVSDVIDTLQFAQNHDEVVQKLNIRLGLPHALDRLHNVSACHLPQSRKIIQQRYQ